MPREIMPRKDALGGDTRRGGAKIPRSGGFRMEKSLYRKIETVL